MRVKRGVEGDDAGRGPGKTPKTGVSVGRGFLSLQSREEGEIREGGGRVQASEFVRSQGGEGPAGLGGEAGGGDGGLAVAERERDGGERRILAGQCGNGERVKRRGGGEREEVLHAAGQRTGASCW